MGVADSQSIYHNLLAMGGTTIKPQWVYHWFHLPHLVASGIIPIVLPFGQNRLMEGGIDFKLETNGKMYFVKWRPSQHELPQCH
jgi:hypothetical protein